MSAGLPAGRFRASCGRRRGPAPRASSPQRSWRRSTTTTCSKARSATKAGNVGPGRARPFHGVTVALLAALGQPEELRSHLAGALNVGITSRGDRRDPHARLGIYAGVPAAGSAMRVAADVLGTDCSPGLSPSTQHHVGLSLGEGDELTPVGTAETLRNGALEDAPYGAGHRGGDVEGTPRLDDEAGVLGGQLQRELRGPVAPVDGLDLAIDVEVRRAGGAQDLDRVRARRCPTPWWQGDRPSRLTTHVVVEGNEAVGAASIVVAEPQRADVEGGAAQGLDVPTPARGDRLIVAPHHEDEHAALRPDRPPGQRRLHQVVTGTGEVLAERAHGRGAVGGQIDEDGAGSRRARPGFGHGGDHIRRRQGQERDVGPTTDLGGVGSRRGTGHRLHGGGVDVIHHHLVAVSHEVRRDGTPDVAQPDHADGHRRASPCIRRNVLAAPRDARRTRAYSDR